jgi:hypothetical protein
MRARFVGALLGVAGLMLAAWSPAQAGLLGTTVTLCFAGCATAAVNPTAAIGGSDLASNINFSAAVEDSRITVSGASFKDNTQLTGLFEFTNLFPTPAGSIISAVNFESFSGNGLNFHVDTVTFTDHSVDMTASFACCGGVAGGTEVFDLVFSAAPLPTPTAVSEPASTALLGLGLLVPVWLHPRKQSRRQDTEA